MVSAITAGGVVVREFLPPFMAADAESSHPALSIRGASSCVTSAWVRPRTGAVRAAAVVRDDWSAHGIDHAFATAGVAAHLVLEQAVTELRVVARADVDVLTVYAGPDGHAGCGCGDGPAAATACISPTVTCWAPSALRSARSPEVRVDRGPKNRPAGPARVTTILRAPADSPVGPGRVSVGITAGAHVRRQCLCGRTIPGSASAEVAAVVRSISVALEPA